MTMCKQSSAVVFVFVVTFMIPYVRKIINYEASCSPPKSKQPNIVIMLLDDHGYGDMGAYDSTVTETPHMDALAKSGIQFMDFHSGASVCTPSRAALLTGRLGLRTGVVLNFNSQSLGGFPTGEKLLSELLPLYYKKHMIGKWHLGHKDDFHPSFRGFDTVFALPYSGDMGCLDMTPQSCKPNVNRSLGTPACPALCSHNNGEVGIPLYYSPSSNCSNSRHGSHNTMLQCDKDIIEQPVNEFTLNNRYAKRAENIIAEAAASEEPFMLYIGFAHTHTPMAYDIEKWNDTSHRPGWKRHYGNTLAEVDDAVGRVVQALERNGLRETTLVWLTSDNGPADVSRVDCDFIGSVGTYRGAWQKRHGGGGGTAKGTVWEGGHRVVSIASWPGTIQGGRVSNDLTSALDIMPTILGLTGTPLPCDRSYDGLDLSELLINDKTNMEQILRKLQSPNSSNHAIQVDGALQRILFHPSNVADSGLLNGMRIGNYKLVFETGGYGACDKFDDHNNNNNNDDSAEMQRQLLPAPLVFNVETDPAESTPIEIPRHILNEALKARNAKMENIRTTLRHTANMKRGTKLDSACCNRDSSVCRCPWQQQEVA